MSKLIRHTLEEYRESSRRTYEGEERAMRVTEWLNGDVKEHNSKASRKRIEDLLSCLREMIAFMESVPNDFDWTNAGYGEHPPVPDEFEELDSELWDRLREYMTYPALSIGAFGKEWGIDYAVCGKRPPGESVAAHSIVYLAQRGLLDRLHQCDCNKWYFARFSHQRSCSPTCRRRVYEKTEKFKAQRRKYMRKYYQLKNSGKVK